MILIVSKDALEPWKESVALGCMGLVDGEGELDLVRSFACEF